MRKTFVMRGQTASGETEVLNFGKYKQGYAYKLTEFQLWPSGPIGGAGDELSGSITAGKTAQDPANPDFDDEGLIGSSIHFIGGASTGPWVAQIVNDTFIITQNLILMVYNSGGGEPVNWQCRFESVKMTGAEEAAVNYKQFAISDE